MTKNARGGSRLTRRRIRLLRAARAVIPIRVFEEIRGRGREVRKILGFAPKKVL
jgi:hypothetical protein